MTSALIIEDDRYYAEMLATVLQRDFTLRIASTLKDALAAMCDSEPDVVLLDVGLPDSKQEETLNAIKQVRDKAAIVIVSGNSEPSFIHDHIMRTASGYIVKSRDDSDHEQLKSEIQKAIANHKACRNLVSAAKHLRN